MEDKKVTLEISIDVSEDLLLKVLSNKIFDDLIIIPQEDTKVKKVLFFSYTNAQSILFMDNKLDEIEEDSIISKNLYLNTFKYYDEESNTVIDCHFESNTRRIEGDIYDEVYLNYESFTYSQDALQKIGSFLKIKDDIKRRCQMK